MTPEDVDAGLQTHQFRLLFQPVVALADDRISGFEALLRWDHPRLGTILPEVFIPIAEESEAICRLGDWTIRRACDYLSQWRRWSAKARTLSISVNLAARQLADRSLPERIARWLDEKDLPPDRLRLEMTESVLIRSPAATVRVVGDLRQVGVGVALDDFGSGYTSLKDLSSFSVNVLKIDRSMIEPLDRSDETRILLTELTRLCDEMGIETVAEGVEREAQVDLLRLMGCNYVQGYYFHPPLDASAAWEMVSMEAE